MIFIPFFMPKNFCKRIKYLYLMKTLIITLVFLFHFLLPLKSNNGLEENNFQVLQTSYVAELGELYQNKGTAKKQISSTEMLEVSVKIYRKKVSSLSQKSFKQQYGRFECRMTIPHEKYVWPAFWMWGSTWPPEIDVHELYGGKDGKKAGRQEMGLHYIAI